MLSKRLANLEESVTLALNAKVKALQASGQVVYNLTAGEPDQNTPIYIQKDVAKALDQNKYTASAGLPALRSAIASSARDFYGAKWVTAENVVVTAGVKPALFASFQALLDPGDEVIIPTPSWVSYRHLMELAGGVVVEVPLRANFDLDTEAIAKKIRRKTKIILINSPHNPTGAVFSAKEIAKLAKAVKNKPIFILSDDIYARLVYGNDYSPITTHPFNKDWLIIVNGFSKSQALTGWRIGYLIAPPTLATAATQLLSHVFGNAPLPGQIAALSALKRGDQPPMLKDLTRRRDLVSKALAKIPRIKFTRPGGAFYFFIDVRQLTHNTRAWCEKLLEQKGVALVPGEAFGLPGFVRLSFAASDKTIVDGLKNLREFIMKEDQ